MSAMGLLLVVTLGAAPRLVVKDGTGREVHLDKSARRIVSLAPHLTEGLFAIGAGGLVVGTVDYSDYPEAAKRIPRVGGYDRFDLETVIALRPDLVVGWQSGNPTALLERLRALGIPVLVSQPNHLEDVADELERLGTLTGLSPSADAAARAFRERLGGLRARAAGRPVVRVFYQVWHRPVMTVGGGQIISDVIHLCGGENVFGSLGSLAPTVSEEAVLAADPEAIIASGMDEARPEWLDAWKKWPLLTASARKNLFFIPPELIQRHTPRVLDGAERLCRFLEATRAHRPATR
jgi:iron complex transport system substrate-binding protein